MDRKSVSYSVQGSSSLKRFKAFNALGAIAFSFGDAMLPEIQVSDLPNYFRLLLRPFSLVLYIFNLHWMTVFLPEHCKRACKKELVSRCISSIHRYYLDLLAIGILWILGIWVRSSALHFGFSDCSRMDNCHGKSLRSYSDIRMLSGYLHNFAVTWMVEFSIEFLSSSILYH